MAFSLLSTKLFIPPARAGAISRPHLTSRLFSGVERPGCFTLISGPAGFGKTTLLSEFIAQVQAPAAWLSLDERDNDPNRFWTYLILACQSVQEGFGQNALDALRMPQPLPEDLIPTLLINELAGQGRGLVLVLDDFHTLQNPSLHSGILFLLDHLPPNLHLILSTRTDPPWPLARFRARNQLIEIRAQDLRFNLEETADFLNRTMGLDLSAQNLAALEERTEGWAAGLQLAALALQGLPGQGRGDVSAYIQAFTGSHVYVAEYLVDEVLKRQPEEMQSFLLQTSILERLNPDLCEAVTGCGDGQAKLRTLQQMNVFIVPLDHEGRWFRYHHLFADLLQARLQTSVHLRNSGRAEDGVANVDVRELHRRAAGWFEQNGMTAEAIEHALTGQDIAHAVQLVEAAALPMILQAYVKTVEGWLQAIPPAWVENSPRINMAYAWMNLLRGAYPQAVPYINRLKNLFAAPANEALAPSLQAEWFGVQAELFIAQGQPEESRKLAEQTLKILPDVDPHIRSMLYVTLAKAFQQTFDYDRAAQVFQMIVRDAQSQGDGTFEVLGISGQGQMILKQGRLHQTYEVVTEGIRRLDLSGKKTPFGATLYGELGQVYYHWGQFDQAREYLRRSMELSGKSGYSDPEIYFCLMRSKMLHMEGDLEGSIREMRKASDLAGIIPPAMIRENVISQQVWIDLATGQPAAAEALLAAEGFSFGQELRFPDLPSSANVPFEFGLLYNSALRVALYHARRKAAGVDLKTAVDLAERVCAGELRCQHLPVALETLMLLGQMYAELGDRRQSLNAVARALELAEPEGFISVFVEEGKAAADLLREILEHGSLGRVRPEYVREILAAYRFPSAGPKTGGDASPAKTPTGEGQAGSPGLVEPLTARELEVLRRIADGDSNQAIAETLVITVSAVKKHTSNIYGKLGVNSRTQAVSRARQLGLLSAQY